MKRTVAILLVLLLTLTMPAELQALLGADNVTATLSLALK